MPARKTKLEEAHEEGGGLLKRAKISNRMKTPENIKSNKIPANGNKGSSKQQKNGNSSKKEDNKKSRSTSFLPKINPNGNRGTAEMRGVNDLTWPHEPRLPKKVENAKKHTESYLDTYELTKMQVKPGNVNLPDIQDKKGVVHRHQRTIGKSKTKEIVKLDVFDNGIDPVKGKFEKSPVLELPTITGQVVKPSPRLSPVSPTRPSAGSPTRSRSRHMKFPPLH